MPTRSFLKQSVTGTSYQQTLFIKKLLTLSRATEILIRHQNLHLHVQMRIESDVDRVELYRLILRFFDDVSTAS